MTATEPLPVLLAHNAVLSSDEVARQDVPVVKLFEGSYLAPLLPMTRSHTWEIRRGAITSLARLSDDELRAGVAALRNLQGRSVLVDLMHYTTSPVCTAIEKREAVTGLHNLCGHEYAQHELHHEGLFGSVLALLRECDRGGEASMKLAVPAVVEVIEILCRNPKLMLFVVSGGFVPYILRIASDDSGGGGTLAGSLRINAIQALTALSKAMDARVERRATHPVPTAARARSVHS